MTRSPQPSHACRPSGGARGPTARPPKQLKRPAAEKLSEQCRTMFVCRAEVRACLLYWVCAERFYTVCVERCAVCALWICARFIRCLCEILEAFKCLRTTCIGSLSLMLIQVDIGSVGSAPGTAVAETIWRLRATVRTTLQVGLSSGPGSWS